MSPSSAIGASPPDALVREVERQFEAERHAVAAQAEREARAILAQARTAARAQVQTAIGALRREGAHRLARAQAQLDAELRARSQHEAARALRNAWPFLEEALVERWRDPQHRREWTQAAAQACLGRLRPGAWRVEHPADWGAQEQQQFVEALGNRWDIKPSFGAAGDITAGLRITADQATLDATSRGLLAHQPMINGLLLDEIESDGTAAGAARS